MNFRSSSKGKVFTQFVDFGIAPWCLDTKTKIYPAVDFQRKSTTRFTPGFTLIELLVVIAIISLLSSIVFTNLYQARARAQSVLITKKINEYISALTLYSYDNEGFPATPLNLYRCLGHGPCLFYGAGGDGPPYEAVLLTDGLDQYLPGTPSITGEETIYIFFYYPPDHVLNDWVGALYRCRTMTNGKCTRIEIYWPTYGVGAGVCNKGVQIYDDGRNSGCMLEIQY